MITGINHITLAIADIERSFAFYTAILGFQPVAKWPKGAYLLAGDTWVALVADPHARQVALPEYTHIAFSISAQEIDALGTRIRASGAPISPIRARCAPCRSMSMSTCRACCGAT